MFAAGKERSPWRFQSDDTEGFGVCSDDFVMLKDMKYIGFVYLGLSLCFIAIWGLQAHWGTHWERLLQ